MEVECQACGNIFIRPYSAKGGRQKKYCDDCALSRKRIRAGDSNASHKKERLEHKLTFIAVDGEGENKATRYFPEWDTEWDHPQRVDPERWIDMVEDPFDEHNVIRWQDYVMLSVGDETLDKNGEELTWQDILPFLYDQFLAVPKEQRKYTVFVGFHLQYDFTMWVRHLYERSGQRLFTKEGIEQRRFTTENGAEITNPVYLVKSGDHKASWEIDVLGMKRMKIRPHLSKANRECKVNHKTPETIAAHEVGTCRKPGYEWMYICDAGPYFQGAFMSVIDPARWDGNPIVSDEEWKILQEGKSSRNAAKFGPEMRRYNVMENEVLSRVMDRMNDGFVQMGIRIPKDKWYGPGAAAQLWLKSIGFPTNKDHQEAVPAFALDAGQKCYYGGRFENAIHGTVPGTVYNYDINSAYPYAMSEMPCLLHGQWTQGQGTPPEIGERTLRMVKARVYGANHTLGALPNRNPKGGVSFPQRTTGWYFQHEIEAGIRAKLITRVKYLEWVDYEPCGCPPPGHAIKELYEQRNKVGKDTPHGIAIKLVLNSLYGKFAQSIGMPVFGCSIYAAYITSHCRTMILEAIASHPQGAKAVTKIATDGIYFISPHTGMASVADKKSLGKSFKKPLGGWDPTEYVNASYFLPGVDWDDKTRTELATTGRVSGSIRSRGVGAQLLANNIKHIDPQWDKLKELLKANNCTTMSTAMPIEYIRDYVPKFTVDLGWGYITPKLALSRNKWNLCGMSEFHEMRQLDSDMTTKRVCVYLDKELIRSTTYHGDLDDETTYYDKTFGRLVDHEDYLPTELSNYVLPEGSLAMVFGEVIQDG